MERDEDDELIRATLRAAGLRRSAALGAMLRAFADEPDRRFRAVDFTKEQQIRPGSVFPLLDKLVRAGVVEVHRSGSPKPASVKTYVLSDAGARFALRYFRIRMGTGV